ncbi:MAG: hybrid sensor histidine kinase/response regulator, partial [Magnetococcales bacterium]|nr:hybrid sensor histidine kinase/response regulator [Magnetococcales bacterium]
MHKNSIMARKPDIMSVGKAVYLSTKQLKSNSRGTDISDKMLIKELQQTNAALLEEIAEYKQEENILRKAKDEAEAVSAAKSKYLAFISHEIRIPLSVVIGLGDLLMETATNELSRGYIRQLQGAGNNLLDLINQILDFSKIEAGQLNLVYEPVSLRTMCIEGTCMMRMIAENKELQLECVVDDAVPEWVMADRIRLRQIVFNLLSNAIKFTEQGKIMLRVRLSNPDTLHLEVEDTGIGISEDYLDHIFNEFTQADASITRRYGGSGLGLTISRH